MTKATKKPRRSSKDDLANCVLFALSAFRNRPVFDPDAKKMEGWHAWFRRALREAGYGYLPQAKDPVKEKL